jgi:hypothetical protein
MVQIGGELGIGTCRVAFKIQDAIRAVCNVAVDANVLFESRSLGCPWYSYRSSCTHARGSAITVRSLHPSYISKGFCIWWQSEMPSLKRDRT